ncbi:MAG: HAMP domain-containing protein, partial [Candidatus Micrarchaeaceae archaeon]
PQKDGHLFTSNHMELFHSIVLNRETIGKIYLRSDMNEIHSMILQYGVISVIVILIVFAIAYLLLARLQTVITDPILNLAGIMHEVSFYKDYTQKANIYSDDEIGFLANGFNHMLEQVRLRDMKLLTEIAERKEVEKQLRQSNRSLRVGL